MGVDQGRDPGGARPVRPVEPAVAAPAGPRFEFGRNWRRFLEAVDESRIARAEQSLRTMLERETLSGLTFLDVGSGSGLFSLAARRLGAAVRSFDVDGDSVACTAEMRRRFAADDPLWTVERGSILDEEFVASLGRYDVVYSWGVLHHTGSLWKALEAAGRLVRPRGLLFIAIYNDQGWRSRCWARVKRLYCGSPPPLRPLIVAAAGAGLWGPGLVRDMLVLRPFKSWSDYARDRGMSPWRDVVDWVGGYPFEVARPEEIFDFYRRRGFTLRQLRTVGGTLGNNEFVLERGADAPGGG